MVYVASLSLILLTLCWSAALCNGGLLQLILLSDAPQKHGAMCLDGSPPGFYFRPGLGRGRSKWIIHLRGGGVCVDAADCVSRSQSFLGSTNSPPYPLRSSSREAGLLSDSFPLNPDFYNWNMADVIYCDGAAYSNHREEPLDVAGQTVYFRGNRILLAVLEALLTLGMKRATDVIFTGCSAGGLAALNHADYVRGLLPPGVKYAVLSDGGIFPELFEFSEGVVSCKSWPTVVTFFNFHNMSAGMDEGCIAEHRPHNEEWRCYFAQNVLPHITSGPVFALNSLHDTGSPLLFFHDCLSLTDCGDGDLPTVLATLQEEFLLATTDLRSQNDTGYFFDSCLRHCQATDDTWFRSVRVEGQLARETFANWYFGRSGGNTRVIDCEEYQCNDSCGTPRDALGNEV